MHIIFLGILFSYGYALEIIPEPSIKDGYPSPEFYRLTKVLSRSRHFHNSDLDIRFEVARNNISESEFSNTCFDSYVAMKFMPKEMNDVRAELGNLAWFVYLNNVTEDFYAQFEEVSPLIYWFINTRLEAVEKLSSEALPETRTFIKQIQSIMVDGFIKLLKSSKDGIYRAINVEYSPYVATRYSKLPRRIKRDLENSLCFRNTINWVNSDMNGIFDKFLNSFSDEVGLNVEYLLEDNEYLSNMPLHEVNMKFRNRSAEYNLAAQEYVDNCAKVFSVMKLTEEEINDFNNSTENFMGYEWGKNEYSESEELLEALAEENAPFFKIISKRWDFLLSYPTTVLVLHFFNSESKEIIRALLHENNRQAVTGERIKLDSKFFLDHEWMTARQLEQYFCLHSTLESIVQREIDLKGGI